MTHPQLPGLTATAGQLGGQLGHRLRLTGDDHRRGRRSPPRAPTLGRPASSPADLSRLGVGRDHRAAARQRLHQPARAATSAQASSSDSTPAT